jgi:hypothetical protein
LPLSSLPEISRDVAKALHGILTCKESSLPVLTCHGRAPSHRPPGPSGSGRQERPAAATGTVRQRAPVLSGSGRWNRPVAAAGTVRQRSPGPSGSGRRDRPTTVAGTVRQTLSQLAILYMCSNEHLSIYFF